MANKFTTVLSSTFAKVKFQTIKYSPEIFMALGIAGSVVGVVLACKATLKAKDDIEDYKTAKIDIESTAAIRVNNEDGTSQLVVYDDEMKTNDLNKVKMSTALQMIKHYSPVIFVEALSIASIIASNSIMRKRALALATAYATLDTSFKDYRNRVIDKYGKDIDNELRYGVKKETIDKPVVDENGNETTEKVETTTVSGKIDEYTRIFDESNPYYEKNWDYNQTFLRSKQSYLNDLLRINKFVSLNDVWDELGYPKTKVGQVVGWVYENDQSYIDLGIYDPGDPNSSSFINGYERSVWLKPNVQGYILDKIDKAVEQ